MATTNLINFVQLYALTDWVRKYTFQFANFAEFLTVLSPPVISSATVTETDGLAALTIASTAFVNGVDSAGNLIRNVTVFISGGSLTGGLATVYSGLVEVTLNTTDVLAIKFEYNVVPPTDDNVTELTLPKLTDEARHYQFPFGEIFDEFQESPAPTIVGTPVLTADSGPTYATPVVDASGQTVAVFISGGSVGSYKVAVQVTLNDSPATTLSIAGVLQIEATV